MESFDDDCASVHGVPIRSTSRALEVLEAVNRLNSPTIMDISQDIQLPYPTVYRILRTLVHDGWIEEELNKKQYKTTQRVQALAKDYLKQQV